MPWSIQCGWEDVPHIPVEEQKRLLASIPPYQRDARSRGVPRLGAGAIYPLLQDEYVCGPVNANDVAHWVMHAYGFDVGWNATAAVRGIWDRGTETITIIDEYKRAHAEPATHIARLQRWGKIMGAIDPASRGRGQRDGKRLFDDYRNGGLLLRPAENAVEAGLFEVYTMLTEGRLKISRTCQLLLQEMSLYHRDDNGKVVKENDHLVDAMRYLVMTPQVWSLASDHQRATIVRGQGASAMSDLDTKAIIALYDSLESTNKSTHGLWEEIAKYMRPQRLGIQSTYSPGADLTTHMYDSTALVASKDWSDAVHFALANPFMAWFGMDYVTAENDDVPADVTDWCQDVTDIMLKHMADSNFTASTNEAISDWGIFGNACIQVHRAPGERFRLSFEALHLRDCVPLIGAHGRIQTTIANWRLTAQAIAEQFATDEWNAGDMDGMESKVGKRVAKALKEGKPQKEFSVLHAVFPRPASDVEVNEQTGMGEPEKRPFGSVWVLRDEAQKPLHVGGYYEQPRFWARMRRRTDDPMGGGIGEIALPDVYSCNEWRRLILSAADKEIDPPWLQESENIMGDMDMRARGVTTVRDLQGMMQVQMQPRTLATMVGQDLRESIRDIWMADEIKLPPRERVGQMTAYEVSKRIERIYQLMGPEIDRLHSEMMRPMLERVFGILGREGRLPQMPESMAEMGAGTLEFKFLGPAVRSQYGEEIAALDDHLGYAMGLAEMRPDVLDSIDIDAHLKKRAELTGYPMDLYRDEDEVEELRAAREQQQQALQQAQVAKDASQAVKNVGGPEAMAQMETMGNA